MTFPQLLALESADPAYTPPPSRKVVDAVVAGLKAEIERLTQRLKGQD